MCNFCESMKIYKRGDAILAKRDPDVTNRYSVAIVVQTVLKSGEKHRNIGCDYPLNFCPECGADMREVDHEAD